MLRHRKPTIAFLGFLVAPLILGPPVAPQIPTEKTPDALAFLTEVFGLYANATSYHLESVEETTVNGEFSRSWSKSLTTAIVAHGSRFRFEAHGDRGDGLQVSDGKTEWIYSPPSQQYTQQAVPNSGPTLIKAPVPGLRHLNGAQRMLKSLSSLQKSVRTASFAPDENIDLNGSTISCKVIKTDGDLPESSEHITARFTFWIDPQTHVIRKMTQLNEGPLRPDQPEMNFVMERKVFFPVAELNLVPSPNQDQLFAFKPPATASLVEKFEDQMSTRLHQLVGKQAPEVSLKAADGKDVTLKSFQGKPVLLDFWATWCAPCVESLPSLEMLYRETARSGLVFVSIDQNEEPQKAAEFWSKHTEPWQNFHATADVLSHFPEHGIPYFVLIDASGQVVFSSAGFDEAALREALGKLCPALPKSSSL